MNDILVLDDSRSMLVLTSYSQTTVLLFSCTGYCISNNWWIGDQGIQTPWKIHSQFDQKSRMNRSNIILSYKLICAIHSDKIDIQSHDASSVLSANYLRYCLQLDVRRACNVSMWWVRDGVAGCLHDISTGIHILSIAMSSQRSINCTSKPS